MAIPGRPGGGLGLWSSPRGGGGGPLGSARVMTWCWPEFSARRDRNAWRTDDAAHAHKQQQWLRGRQEGKMARALPISDVACR